MPNKKIGSYARAGTLLLFIKSFINVGQHVRLLDFFVGDQPRTEIISVFNILEAV